MLKAYSSCNNLISVISKILIGPYMNFFSLTSPTCYNSSRKSTLVKRKVRQKAGYCHWGRSGAFIVNFYCISLLFFVVSIVEFEQVNASWTLKTQAFWFRSSAEEYSGPSQKSMAELFVKTISDHLQISLLILSQFNQIN